MRRTHPVVALTFVIILASCNQDSGQTDTTTAIPSDEEVTTAANVGSPCSLLTPDEVGAVLGKSVTRHEEVVPNSCVYYTEGPVIFLDLEVDQQNAAAAWKGVNIGHEMIDAGQDAAAGLGEKAFFGPRDRLYVLQGDTFLAIEAGFDDKVRERAPRVAALVLDKLP